MTDSLQAFIRHFVQRHKRERYLALLSNAKRRSEGLWDLLHDGRHFDKTKFVQVPGHQRDTVKSKLTKMGVKEPGYVLAIQGELDGQHVPLDLALQHYLGTASDVALYFSAPNAGYYENHTGEVFLFSA